MTTALEALKGLAKKKPVPATLVVQIGDPAVDGAKRDGATVLLGLDLSFTERAAYAAQLKEALAKAEQDFASVENEMRSYGASKRLAYNDAYKCNITTVKVPFEVETPGGKETRVVSVICTNKYSVNQDMILGNREALGSEYVRLFSESKVKALKPNAEELIRGVFKELGLSDEEVQTSMDSLFEEKISVKTRETYEQDCKSAPEEVRLLLSKAVRRQAPGLKF